MEEIKLPTVPELELIPIERRNFPEEDHKQEKIQHKRKERDSAARGLIAVTVASMMHTLTVSDLSTVQRPSSVSKMAAWVCGADASTGRLHSSGIRSGRHTEKQRRHKNT